VLNTSRTFFGLTLEACSQMSQMFAAKLYDKTSGAVTVKSLLDAAQSQAGMFKHGTPQEVSAAVKEAETRVAALVPILKSVQDRRNQALAHLDSRTVTNPAALDVNAKSRWQTSRRFSQRPARFSTSSRGCGRTLLPSCS
jgi:hypothetical protein